MKSVASSKWTCDSCGMTVSFAAGADDPRLPSTWTKERGKRYCLACRRDAAGEAAVDAASSNTPAAELQKLQTQGRIEFEIRRDPSRQDNRIANSCNTSVVAVRKARARLGL